MPDIYSMGYALRDSAQRNHILGELADIRRHRNISQMKIIELGCGLGHNLKLFAEENQVRGIEVAPDIAEHANAHGIATSSYDLNNGLSEPDSSYDVVICLDVLEHLTHPFECTREIHRILKPNGIAILNVPNHFDLKGRIKILLGSDLDVHAFFPESHEWDNPHLRFFTYQGFRKMLTLAHLEITEDRSSSFPSLPLLSKYRPTRTAAKRLAKLSPGLFAGGFFVIAQRNSSQ